MALVASAVGLGYVLGKYERLPRVELSSVLDEPEGPGRAENYLIVGIDNASELPPGDSVRIGRDPTDLRSDTIMIVRTDPTTRQAALLSLPRDLYVTLADGMGSGRINVAFQRGGPRLLIRTIAQDFGIEVNHYLQVDFASFRQLVDAIGGVPVPIPRPARDRETGLDIRRAGCHTLDPVEALAYVRSRHYEELVGGRWVEDVRSDIGRIARQQDFVRRALSRAIDRGARNPGTLDQLIDVALAGITVDDQLTADDIFDLGTRFRSFDPGSLVTYAIEGTPATVGEAQVLRMVEGPRNQATLALFRGRPGELVPASVQVTVRNGTDAPRQGAEAAMALGRVGFAARLAGDEPGGGGAGTVVRHPPGQEAAADLVRRWLVGGARLQVAPGTTGIEVVTGTDWRGVRDEAAAPTTSTTATTLPPPTGAPSPPTTGAPPPARTPTTPDLATFRC